MDTLTLSGWSAFQFYRIPPAHLRAVLIAAGEEDLSNIPIPESRPYLMGIDLPVQVLCSNRDRRPQGKAFLPRTRSHELPRGSYLQIGSHLFVTSPSATLLTLAADLSSTQLAMAASELAGTFAIFKGGTALSPPHEDDCMPQILDHDHALEAAGKCSIWRNVRSFAGSASDLWQRPQLASRAGILSYVHQCAGIKGCKKLRAAVDLMVENAASPLEVQTAMLLGSPVSKGGAGLPILGCNIPIELHAPARRIAGSRICYGDVVLESADGRLVDVECQSELCHDEGMKVLKDFERAVAIQIEGIEIVHVTKHILNDERSFDEVARLIGKKLGLSTSARAARAAKRAAVSMSFRDEVLTGWNPFSPGIGGCGR